MSSIVINKLKMHKTKGRNAVLTKSELVSFKSHLHTSDEIRAFKILVKLAEADPDLIKGMSIPELRKAIIAMV